MEKITEGSKYWLGLFQKMCPQSSITEWDGVDFYDIAQAAKNGDKSAKEAIFWQMKDIIEAIYAKNKKSVYLWSNQLGLSEKNPEGTTQVNEMALNWISASWSVIFDGYPISENETIGPLIKHVQPTKGLDYLSWIYSKKILNLLYKEYYLDNSTGQSKTKGADTISANLYADKREDNGGNHSIKRELIDDWCSEIEIPEEEFALSDSLKAFKAFAKDPELNEKKHGFSPMIAFRTVIMNMAKGEDAEKNIANLALKYNVARNTFAAYAQKAATALRDEYDVSLEEIQNLIKRYGANALARIIKENTFIPKQLTRINENYNFKLLESLFTGKAILNESDESIYDAHAEYEKDVEQKKEEDDNQENLTFDEGSVKLTNVKEDTNKYYVRVEYAESGDSFDDIYGPFNAEKAIKKYNSLMGEFGYAVSQGCAEVYYCDANGDYARPPLKESLWNGMTGQIAECPCCGHVFHEKDEADYECPECGEFLDFDDLNWHPDGDEYQDGEDNRVVIDPLEQMSESTNLKESSFKSRAQALCKELTNDDDLDQIADNILCFIYSMISEAMDYFPIDAYDPGLWQVFLENKEKYENVLN
jgi:hypothetical protein